MVKKLRVAAYCRVSTDKLDQVNSLNSQRQYFTDYINNHDDWTMVNVYYDEGITGTSTKKRRGFNNMISDAKAGKIDLILTKEISRFARNTLDSLKFTRDLKDIGIGVIFINDNINTLDPDSELRLTIMASIAQEESRKTSDRVKWGQKRRMEQGVVFGRDMLGYYVREGKLIINPEEAEIVKLIFYKYLHEEKGTHVIARELWEAGIKSKQHKRWNNIVILRVLRNEKYVGDLLQKKTYTPDYLSHSKKYNRGHEDMVYLQDHHEPIIDRDTWDKVQDELARRSPNEEQKSKHSNRYWCSGKIKCGECGQRFVSQTKQLKNGTQYKAWQCYAAANHGRAKQDMYGNPIGCNNHTINDKTLLTCAEYVLKHIQMNRDKIIHDLTRDVKMVLMDLKVIDTAKLRAKIDELNGKKKSAINLTIDGIISKSDLALMNEQYNADIADIQNKLFEAENAGSFQQQQIDNINECINEIRKLVNVEASDLPLYRELIEKIVVHNDYTVDMYFKFVPYGIRLHYTTSGRLDKYRTNIDSMRFLNAQ